MYHRRFDPFATAFLGQEESSSWRARALAAVSKYDAILARALALPANDAKASLMVSFGEVGGSGMPTFPGTPADRYRFVRDSIVSDGPWDDIHQGYIQDLENADAKLEPMVANLENSSGGVAVVGPDGRLTGLGWGIVGASAIGLFVVPFLLE